MIYIYSLAKPETRKIYRSLALIDAKKWGLIRSIGVCNFLPEHIEQLEKETGVKPSINQIELHPYFNQAEQRKWHAEHHIQTQSWSPLFSEALNYLKMIHYKPSPKSTIKLLLKSFYVGTTN